MFYAPSFRSRSFDLKIIYLLTQIKHVPADGKLAAGGITIGDSGVTSIIESHVFINDRHDGVFLNGIGRELLRKIFLVRCVGGIDGFG